ncbi:MAG: LamG domain-containing protein [Planctomycetota bacterium]|jgi:hypothetical protein
MCRKIVTLISIVSVLVMLGDAAAEDKSWGGGGTNSWCEPGNWAPSGVPTRDDMAVMNGTPEQGPIIDVGCDANVGSIQGPCYRANTPQQMDIIGGSLVVHGNWQWDDADDKEAQGPGTVNIGGNADVQIKGSIRGLDGAGSVTIINISDDPNILVRGELRAADNSASFFELNMSGGTLRTTGRLFWGDNGSGNFNMSGGALYVGGEMAMRGRDGADYNINMTGGYIEVGGNLGIPTSDDANAFICLDGGEIHCGDFVNPADANWQMDITYGKIVISGDKVSFVNEKISAGRISAFGGAATVEVKYDPFADKTTLRATITHEIAYNPAPEHGTINLCPDVALSWTPGEFVVDHNIYFGTGESDVNESAVPVATHVGPNSWDPPGELELNTRYYWRIDGVNDANANSPWEGGIWFFTTDDGNAYDPSPSNNQTVVPLDTKLSWTPGCVITGHDVYLGTDFNDVRDATTAVDPNGVYQTRLPAGTTEFDPCGLAYFTWYYWRIDEVNNAEIRAGEVWGFRSQSAIFDPNLLVWYKFDEKDPNTSAYDHSGHERHLGVGSGNWDPNDGFDGGSLVFDNDLGPEIPLDVLAPVSSANSPAITVAVWVNGQPGQEQGKDMPVFDGGDDSGDLLDGEYKLTGLVASGDGDVVWRAGNDTNDVLYWREASPTGWEGEWHHFAFIKDAATMTIYFDGLVAKSTTEANSATLANFADKTFKLGAYTGNNDDYQGKLDEFRIYDYALSPGQIAGLFRGADLASAWGPVPSDGQTQVASNTDLSWKPGDYADKHDVYFGTSFDDINDADTTTPVIYRGRQNLDVNYYDLDPLELEATYYWRIDEVNDANGDIWKGKVWRFTVAEYVIIDDMESYDTADLGNLIYDTWDDGFSNWTGSQLDLSYSNPDLFYTGKQGMRYVYDNALGYYKYSEIDANTTGPRPGNLKVGSDWTAYDVKLLRLWFRGTSANALEQMYMALEDTPGHVIVINYGDYGESLSDITVENWQDWRILLPDFETGGINLQNVQKIRLGFGDRDNPAVGGSGTMYLDDIRLYPPICVPEMGPAADFSGNCIVDLADVMIMAEQWLRTDVEFDAVQAPLAPIGWWKLEGNALDSSANANHGTMEGAYSWVEGHIDSNAIEFDGGRLLVEDNGSTPELRPQDQVSVSAWVNYGQDQGHSARVVVKGADDGETYSIEVDDTDTFAFLVRDPDGERYAVTSDRLYWNEWIHLAGTFDGTSVKCYVNGELADSSDDAAGITLSQDTSPLAIGNRSDATDREFAGMVDDVRVYDYGLSAAEVAYIAGQGTTAVKLTSTVNLYNTEPAGEGAVNFRDYAELMNSWLEEKLWPQ